MQACSSVLRLPAFSPSRECTFFFSNYDIDRVFGIPIVRRKYPDLSGDLVPTHITPFVYHRWVHLWYALQACSSVLRLPAFSPSRECTFFFSNYDIDRVFGIPTARRPSSDTHNPLCISLLGC